MTAASTAPASGPPAMLLLQIATGYMPSQAIYVAAKLGIADCLIGGARSAGEIARDAGADADAMHRLLRMLAAFGVFQEDEHGRFQQSPLSELLRSDVAGSLRQAVIMWNEEQYRAWGEVLHSVRTGTTAFDHVFGASLFSYLAAHPDAAATFDAAMTNLTTPIAIAVAAGYDFSSARTVVDVGGGRGILLRAILDAFPAAHGVLFDLPNVASHVDVPLALRERCIIIGGSFFESVPTGGDVYLLAQVLHNWNDEQALAILKNCQRAMTTGGRLLVIEAMVGGPAAAFAALSDMHMLTVVGGRERTETEYRQLLSSAGLTLTRLIPTLGPQVILEAIRDEI